MFDSLTFTVAEFGIDLGKKRKNVFINLIEKYGGTIINKEDSK